MTHKEVAKYIATTNLPSSVQHAAMELQYWSSLFKLKRGYYWGIELKKDNKLIGTIGYNMLIFTHMRAEISYDLSFDHWGQGIMSRSLEKVLEFSYSVLKLVRLQALQIVKKDKKVSISYVQRSLRIGYNRAATIIERMEKEGIISPPNHSGKREILTKE